ncbi:hypothetical protein PRZ48_002488 [Zasmidium cellare]|uniref:Carboxylic ester hydrolase n=1 Tax=Zasmidium cellare TaxID=395010 RepID=A0ABR0F468_ZASCE|nr:hypothetical protein PRZ48_002488 [Zasmidium cellare]
MLFYMVILNLAAGFASASSLAGVCTTAHARASLPHDAYQGILIDDSSVQANSFSNISISDVMYPDAVIDYCNVTFAYSHEGRVDDRVLVTYWLPAPDKFENRFLATGGGGLAINSGNTSVAGAIPYGAAAGLTDGGFGSFDVQWDEVFLLANNTVNWQSVYMMGYQAIHEMTVIGKAFTQNFYNSNSTLYTYYQGCSEGGREGFSQVQRFAETYDGAIIGAPALRYSFQQVNHLHSGIVEQTLDYYPPSCELDKIANATIKACDGLDGKRDGVVSRTDLCALQFDLKSIIGAPYSCPATVGSMMTLPAPAQNGTVTEKGIAVVTEILKGLQDSQGRQVYVPYQFGATFADAATEFNNATGKWQIPENGLGAQSYGSEWVERYLLLQNSSTLPTLKNVTYDSIKEWMVLGLHMYSDSLQTTWPDLSSWQEAGNKILHYHGESDNSIPTAASVRYRESVRKIMYPHLSYNASEAALSEWYKFYSIPGAAHCSDNPYQPNAAFPQTNLKVMIGWVEKGVAPDTLNATVLLGENKGANQQICAWPLRPFWNDNGAVECVYDQKSLNSWFYDLDAIKVPVF